MRVVGSAHSPNACAMSDDSMVTLSRLSAVLSIDRASGLVRVQAGILVWRLTELLDEVGLALPNLGSISDQTLAGMISTGTHGTGAGLGCMATFIVELELVLADGSEVVCSLANQPDLFRAALCSVGVLGVITAMTLRTVPAFDLHAVESSCTLTDVLGNLPARVASAPWYKFVWFPHTTRVMEFRGTPCPPRLHRAPPPGLLARLSSWLLDDIFGFRLLECALWVSLHVPSLVPLINKVWGSTRFEGSRERVDRSDRVFNINCLFKQHVDEWAIPVDALPCALRSLQELIEGGKIRAHFPVEVRFTAGDDIWLSPSYGRPTAWVGIIAYKPYGCESPYKAYFRAFEDMMGSLGGRPHFAKDFHWEGREHFAAAYERWDDFELLRAAVDPTGLFLNPWARRVLGLPVGGPAAQAAVGGASVRRVSENLRRATASTLSEGSPLARTVGMIKCGAGGT